MDEEALDRFVDRAGAAVHRSEVRAAAERDDIGPGDPQGAPTVFGLGGLGGSFACGNTATGVSWAVTKNRISNDFGTSIQLGQLIAGPG